jgi:DNA-directed RNA polymerase subunit RPC12/RpoP
MVPIRIREVSYRCTHCKTIFGTSLYPGPLRIGKEHITCKGCRNPINTGCQEWHQLIHSDKRKYLLRGLGYLAALSFGFALLATYRTESGRDFLDQFPDILEGAFGIYAVLAILILVGRAFTILLSIKRGAKKK